jgi:hypothetical protein
MGTEILGRKVKDRITGFNGVVTGYVKYLTGCNQCLVIPPMGKENKKPDGEWFDEQRLEVLKGLALVLDNSKANGFDKAAPKY